MALDSEEPIGTRRADEEFNVTECIYNLTNADLISNSSRASDAEATTASVVFWLCVSICIVLGIISSLGNGLVVYVSYKKEDFGGFRHVNSVVKNLALSDCLFGLIGCPLTIVFWYWGKTFDCYC